MSVQYHRDSGAGIITMTDGAKGNRLNSRLISELTNALDILTNDNDVRFILIRSLGPNFCLGMDLDAFTTADIGTQFQTSVEAYALLLKALHTCPKTVVCLLQGSVKAGGVGLVAACDVVIAADTVTLELSELYLGLIPANVMPYILTMRLPLKRAAYLVQSAACIDAMKALTWGLVDEVYPMHDLEKALKQLGRRLMRISPEATTRQKIFTQNLANIPIEHQGELAVEQLVALASKPSVLDAVQRFSDGDLPPWFKNFRPEGPLSTSDGGKNT